MGSLGFGLEILLCEDRVPPLSFIDYAVDGFFAIGSARGWWWYQSIYIYTCVIIQKWEFLAPCFITLWFFLGRCYLPVFFVMVVMFWFFGIGG